MIRQSNTKDQNPKINHHKSLIFNYLQLIIHP
jgi:hypothetical protein